MTANKTVLYLLLLFMIHRSAFSEAINVSTPAPTSLDLMDCYELSLKRSESLAIQKEEIERAEANFFIASGEVLGDVSFVGTKFNQEEVRRSSASSSTSSSSENTNLTRKERREAKFVVSQPLFQGFRALGVLTAAGSLKNQRKGEWMRAQQLLFLDVARAFYDYLYYQKDLELIEQIIKLFEERAGELKEREKIGRSRPSELSTANARLRVIEAERARSRGALKVAGHVLEFLIGTSLEGTRLTDSELQSEPSESVSEFLETLNLRPDVEAARNALKISHRNIIVAQSDLWPTISLDHNRYTRRDGSQSDIDWDVLFTVDVPLFRGGETIGNIKDAVSQWKQSKYSYSLAQRQAELDVKQSYDEWNSSKDQYDSLKKSVVASEENFKFQREDYDRNLVNNLDVLEALEILHQTSRDANEMYYQMKFNYWNLFVQSGQFMTEGQIK